MKPVKLGNEKALQLTNSLLLRELQNKISSSYNVDIEYKRYHFLDKSRAAELKQKEHSFVLNTFGAKYLLFLTYVNFKPYAIYINRKNNTFFLVKTRFSIELYNDTIFEGETVKINEKWFFLVSDCLVHCGEQIMLKNFKERYGIISSILENEYVSDPYLEPFCLIKKDVFSYHDIIDVKEKYISTLPFNVNGYLFKCENNASYDILYIFPECRNKQQVEKTDKTNVSENNEKPVVVNQIQKQEDMMTATDSPKLEEKTESTFLMKLTEFPDVYEIYMFDKVKGKKARIGYAGIPNIAISKMVREWFSIPDDESPSKVKVYPEIYARFKKHPINEKWIPQCIVNQ